MATQLDAIERKIKEAEQELAKRTKEENDAQTNLAEMQKKAEADPFGVWKATAKKQQELLEKNIVPAKEKAQKELEKLKELRQAQLELIEKRKKRLEKEREAIKRMNLTTGGLLPAMIYPVDREGVQKIQAFATVKDQLKPIYFRFNPKDYTIKKKAKYKGKGLNQYKNYNLEFDTEIQPRQLTINSIWFDTSETGKDVREYTDRLLNYVEVQAAVGQFQKSKAITQPPFVAFEWGTFRFMAVVESVTLDFVYFKPDGTPLRAKASISFKEFKHRKLYARQNPTSGGGPHSQTWEVSSGDRLDTIAASVYGDATRWRLIADHNQLENPWNLKPGLQLQIPPAWTV
ncbi:MAG: hypothetical protein AAF490_00565 [Chloroflexota bacterium]